MTIDDKKAAALAARRLAAWIREPWKCLACQSENIEVRSVELPGGQQGNVRRVANARWESRCVACGLSWAAVFTPSSIDVYRTKIGFAFLEGDS